MDIERIWSNVKRNEGEVFRQIKGKEFSYKVNNSGNSIYLSTTNQAITKNLLAQAVELMPFSSTAPLQHLRAPSYLFALLTDNRILQK